MAIITILILRNKSKQLHVYIFMRIFDLHNDALTCGGKINNSDAIYAIWTTNLSYQQVAQIAGDNKSKMLSIEDCGVFVDNLADAAKFDFMYYGLTWNGFNGLAGGTNVDEHLTERGKQLISILNEGGMVIDTAHLNRASFYEVAEQANKIICSHTCFYDLNKHPRNLTREQISVIIDKGGIVGLCFVCDFLGGNSIDDVVKHIDWFVDCFGDKHLAIGTDFFGTLNLPKGLTTYKSFDSLVLALIRRGYSDATIHNILYGNAAAYFFE